ncbi:hypothetical protein BG005_010545 [Podila minutissima]|nr:hypothetical protein BG005_010545 [Podila minutissima]
MSDPEIQILSASQLSIPDALHIKAEVYKSTAKTRAPLTAEDWANMKKPKVLIVGAGIGGLMLANLLQKGNIPFDIYERANEVKPLGSAMTLGCNVWNVMAQLGLREEFKSIGIPLKSLEIFNEKLQTVVSIDATTTETLGGTGEFLVSRPKLYDILLRPIPKERIHLGKKVLSFLQNENGVMIRCADDSTVHIHGDILVGCDGAYSAVRQLLYKDLKEKKLLPAGDNVPLPYSCVCLVGQTEVLDPEEFPGLKGPNSQAYSILGTSRPINWTTFTTKQNTICWLVVQFLDKDSAKDNDSFRNSEWGPEAAEVMCKEVRDFKLPGGKDGALITIGDLIDRTPKNLISKVMLEEKVFDTWFSGRTVLLGDDVPELESIFKEYKAERHPIAKENFAHSQQMRNIGGKNLVSKATRQIFRHMPKWLWRLAMIKNAKLRPQASFLPQVEDNGTVKAGYQPSLHKTLAILKERAEAEKRRDVAAVVAV